MKDGHPILKRAREITIILKIVKQLTMKERTAEQIKNNL